MINKIIFIVFLFLIPSREVYSYPMKYLCNSDTNHFFITLDTKKKTIIIGNSKPNVYWTEADYIFWQSANDYTVYEYTFKYSYNKLSGALKVKSHHLVTSKDDLFNYKCAINQ